MKYIVDLSEFNTVTSWSLAKKEIEYAIIRIGYRGSIPGKAVYGKITEDAKFKSHLNGLTKNSIPYTVYFFTTAITEAEAVEEANWIKEKIIGLDINYPIFIDNEKVAENGRADQLSKEQRTKCIRALTDKLLDFGIPCGVYSYTSWLNNMLDMSALNKMVLVNTWVAQNPTLTYKGDAALWQYGKKKFDWSTAEIDVNKQLHAFNMSGKKEKMKYYRSVIVDKAKSFLGAATGSTKHKEIVNTYNNYTSSHKGPWRAYKVTYNDAWCATFVSAIAIMCGYESIIPIECGCPQLITQAKTMGIWQENDAYKPKPGDILLFDWQDSGSGENTGTPDHVGYVETVSGNSITVIEGNSGNAEKVARTTRQINGKYIRGYICPKYTADSPPVAKKKIPLTINLPELHPGDTGEAVRLWQFISGAPITGVLDEAETLKWQKNNGKKQDGWVGKGCWTKGFQLKGMM